jgi:hypothetical protein
MPKFFFIVFRLEPSGALEKAVDVIFRGSF